MASVSLHVVNSAWCISVVALPYNGFISNEFDFQNIRKTLLVRKLNSSNITHTCCVCLRGSNHHNRFLETSCVTTWVLLCCVMTLHWYFKPISGKLPDLNGDLSKEMPSAVIREANKGVEKATEATQNKKCNREKYGRFTPTQATQAARFAVEHENQAAICQYSEEFRMEIKDSTLSTWRLAWRSKYWRIVSGKGSTLSQVKLLWPVYPARNEEDLCF